MRCDQCEFWSAPRPDWEARGKCSAPLPKSVPGDAVKCTVLPSDGDECESFHPYGQPSSRQIIEDIRAHMDAQPSDLRGHIEGDESPGEKWWTRLDQIIYGGR
jgi:hypothetical protein